MRWFSGNPFEATGRCTEQHAQERAQPGSMSGDMLGELIIELALINGQKFGSKRREL